VTESKPAKESKPATESKPAPESKRSDSAKRRPTPAASEAAEAIAHALVEAALRIGASRDDVHPKSRPRASSHGDLATNLALVLAKPLNKPPRALADALVKQLPALLPAGLVRKIDVAGPGFINFFLETNQVVGVIAEVLARGADYGRATTGRGVKVNVEFVSANPTGPLHVGHGRGAALGDGIAALLEWAGHAVTREFYVNDAGTQIEKLALSLWARIQQQVGRPGEIPDGGYQGEYLVELAAATLAREGRAFADCPPKRGCAAAATSPCCPSERSRTGPSRVRCAVQCRQLGVGVVPGWVDRARARGPRGPRPHLRAGRRTLAPRRRLR